MKKLLLLLSIAVLALVIMPPGNYANVKNYDFETIDQEINFVQNFVDVVNLDVLVNVAEVEISPGDSFEFTNLETKELLQISSSKNYNKTKNWYCTNNYRWKQLNQFNYNTKIQKITDNKANKANKIKSKEVSGFLSCRNSNNYLI